VVDLFRCKRMHGDDGWKKVVVCCCLCMVRVLIMSHDLPKKFEVN
jgi:hypothetical protein